MKICHILESGGGGSGKTTLFLAQYLAGRGHDITLIYSPVRATEEFIAAAHAIAGLQIVPLNMQRAVGWHDIWSVFRLSSLLRRLGPFDIIHSHSSKAGGLARLAGLLLPAAIQIYTPHAFVTMDPAAPSIYRSLERMLSRLCNRIIVVSKAECTHAVEVLKIAQAKMAVIPNGVRLDYPADRSQARRELGFEEKAQIIGFVGRLSAQKRPERAIASFALLADAYPRSRLAIVGAGPLESILKKQVAELGLEKRVKFYAGYDARDLMPGFDALLCSSDYEGFANIFLEALVAGVPIVTTPVGGAEEAVLSGRTGLVSKDFSSASLAAELIKILNLSPGQKAEWTAAAEKHRHYFTLEQMGSRTLAAYHCAQKNKEAEAPNSGFGNVN